MYVPGLPIQTQERLQNIIPYGVRHGENLSPEQKDVIAPAIQLCEDVLDEGQTAILLGSRALAPFMLPNLTDPEQHSSYLAYIGSKDFDLHIGKTSVYGLFINKLDTQTRLYAYGVRGAIDENMFDIIDNERLASAYLEGMRKVIEQAEAGGTHVTQAKEWLKLVEQGNSEYIIPLTRTHASSTVGVRLVKRDGKIETEVFDPLGFLEQVKTRNSNLETTMPINPYSTRFLFLLSLASIDLAGSPYSTNTKHIPEELTDPVLKEIAHSALGELPSIAKTLIAHNLNASDINLKVICYATRVLAQIDPYYAVENPYIANYVKNAQALVATNLQHFEETMSLMFQELPLGWCICPDSSSSNEHIARGPVVIGTKANPTAARILPVIHTIIERNGNPSSLEEALGMYLAAEFGRAHPTNTPDPIERKRHIDRISAWWQDSSLLDGNKMLEYFNYFDELHVRELERVESIRA
jgi:hypothetical protein